MTIKYVLQKFGRQIPGPVGATGSGGGSSKQVITVLRDAVGTITPPYKSGKVLVAWDGGPSGFPQLNYFGEAIYDVGSSPDIRAWNAESKFVVGTGVPTGTTPAVDRLGLYAHSDGKLYLVNRQTISDPGGPGAAGFVLFFSGGNI